MRGGRPAPRAEAVLFQHLAHARAALAAWPRAAGPLRLLTPPGGAAHAGPEFYRHVVEHLRAEHPDRAVEAVLDCGDDGALALEALRDGWRHLVLRPARLRRKVAAAARPFGAAVRALPPPAIDPEEFPGDRLAAAICHRIGPGIETPADVPMLPRKNGKGHATMRMTRKVKQILDCFESDNPGTKANLCRILMQGKLAGTGRMVILPVDQGFEHGPARSFAPNPAAYDPHYHFQLAIDAGLNAYAAPLGMIEAGADTFAGQIPTILKVNSANSLFAKAPAKDQAVTAGVDDALRLGCSAIGFTIYPGSEASYDMIEEIRELAAEAKSVGLAVVVWSYPRGGDLSKDGETAMDVTAYAAQIAALIGAHIIKVKLPTDKMEQAEARQAYEKNRIDISDMAARVKHIMQSSFNGRRLVVFSGGTLKGENALYDEAKAIHQGGGNGSIIGRNTFQRPREEALALLNRVIAIYQGKEG